MSLSFNLGYFDLYKFEDLEVALYDNLSKYAFKTGAQIILYIYTYIVSDTKIDRVISHIISVGFFPNAITIS